MALAVVTKASGGLPITWVSAVPYALPITEATSGIAVTQVANGGLPATYITVSGTVVVPVPPFATFDPATVSDTTLSNGNLTAFHVIGNVNTGVKGAPSQSSGKYYFEIMRDITASSDGVGLITTSGTYANVLAGTNCTIVFITSGNISSNNSATGKNITGIAAGTVTGIAIDLTARKAWFRKGAAGNWNGLAIGSENPATGLGGVTVAPTVSFLPVVAFGSGAGGQYTANFGATVYVGTPPSGFGNWPAS